MSYLYDPIYDSPYRTSYYRRAYPDYLDPLPPLRSSLYHDPYYYPSKKMSRYTRVLPYRYYETEYITRPVLSASLYRPYYSSVLRPIPVSRTYTSTLLRSDDYEMGFRDGYMRGSRANFSDENRESRRVYSSEAKGKLTQSEYEEDVEKTKEKKGSRRN